MVDKPGAVRESYEVPVCCAIGGLDAKIQDALSKRIIAEARDKEIASFIAGLKQGRQVFSAFYTSYRDRFMRIVRFVVTPVAMS